MMAALPLRLAAALLALLMVTGCARGDPARPALWEVTGPQGQRGWLFGTIHALPRKADWRGDFVDRALRSADLLVLEIAASDDPARTRAVFDSLATSPALPSLIDRAPSERRTALMRLLDKKGLSLDRFDQVETWAAAIILAREANADAKPEYGIERELLKAMPALPRAEFEGADAQLAIFDTLAEEDQRVLLTEVLADDTGNDDLAKAAAAWRKGDLAEIERQTHTGMMADPEIRNALLVRRNQAWLAKLEPILRSGRHPFAAVGTAHLVGRDGLPALLAARGWTVRRLQ